MNRSLCKCGLLGVTKQSNQQKRFLAPQLFEWISLPMVEKCYEYFHDLASPPPPDENEIKLALDQKCRLPTQIVMNYFNNYSFQGSFSQLLDKIKDWVDVKQKFWLLLI